jgi:hypothetical protein
MSLVIIAFVIVIAVISFVRLRRGGPGPAVNGVPRAFRGRLNAVYKRAGWQQPYDDAANRSPDRTKL